MDSDNGRFTEMVLKVVVPGVEEIVIAGLFFDSDHIEGWWEQRGGRRARTWTLELAFAFVTTA